ncbi:MAG: RdgB/HAM1 family non-canonical purine NTP pyrophosphatase [Spirochaetaceae bacterium]|nr:RdgB/HAM1 family non-canonical purine NTP pyrophosphatase [Spirochaetaceae bacterium]
MIKEIFLATNNAHKHKEFQLALPHIRVRCPSELGLAFNPCEDGNSFLENALIKARTLYQLVHTPVIADDSGLCVKALDGAPGIHSARYSGLQATNANGDNKNIVCLLENMKDKTQREAFFVACIVLYLEEDRFMVIQEKCLGEITEVSSGISGFGYDPIFYLPTLKKTMAELSETEKNEISHRGKALKILKPLLDSIET